MLLARPAIFRGIRSLVRNGPRVFGSQAQTLTLRTTSTLSGKNENVKNVKEGTTLCLAALAGALAAGTVTLTESEFWHPPKPATTVRFKPKAASKFYSITANNIPPKRPDLPTIPLEQVGEHNDEGDMWFTFRGAVYDMSFFLNG